VPPLEEPFVDKMPAVKMRELKQEYFYTYHYELYDSSGSNQIPTSFMVLLGDKEIDFNECLKSFTPPDTCMKIMEHYTKERMNYYFLVKFDALGRVSQVEMPRKELCLIEFRDEMFQFLQSILVLEQTMCGEQLVLAVKFKRIAK
jgi:hypothetical protein